MTLKELKQKLNDLPSDYDEFNIVFGECAWGESLKKIKNLGHKIYLSFV